MKCRPFSIQFGETEKWGAVLDTINTFYQLVLDETVRIEATSAIWMLISLSITPRDPLVSNAA